MPPDAGGNGGRQVNLLRPGRAVGPTLLALLTGALQAASLAWPLPTPTGLAVLGLAAGQPLWWGPWLALATLVQLLRTSPTTRIAAWRSWCFATSWLGCTFGWLFTSMHTYGGLSAPLAVLAVLALAGLLALYYAAAGALFRHLTATPAELGTVQLAARFAAVWLLAELCRGVLLTGFGWGAVGYTQLSGPLTPLIAWVGVYGVGALTAFGAALLAGLLASRAMRHIAQSGLILLALVALPQLLPPPQGQNTPSLSVTLLQGNIAQNEKFELGTGVPKALRWYGQQLQASRSALIISPETALALLPDQLPEGYWDALRQRFSEGGQAALVGIPLGSYEAGYTNSVVGLRPGLSAAWQYDKHHLVPFGEFIPPFFRWFTNLMNIPLGDFKRGALPQPTFDWQGQRIAATICYENLFSEELATQFTDASKAPTILVNISNLGWFGDSLAMNQHLQITRMRSLEFDRPFLLATNTGHTAIVNHRAQATHAAPPHTATALQGEVLGRSGLTPYARWVGPWGLWPLWALAVGVVLAALVAHRAGKAQARRPALPVK